MFFFFPSLLPSSFHIVLARLHGMQRDLLCNPMKSVVSGKVLFVPGGREMGQLKGQSIQGLEGGLATLSSSERM